jgi:UDP:flavonoid glycosyltransferase YjiC (YdhE family)
MRRPIIQAHNGFLGRCAMRVLFTSLPFWRHAGPLIPIARAVHDAGHAIAFATVPNFLPMLEREGFAAFPVGWRPRGSIDNQLFGGRATVDVGEVIFWDRSHIFAEMFAATMAPDIITLSQEWHPDLIVRESMEFGGCVAAEVLGLPHASVRSDSGSSSYSSRLGSAGSLDTLRLRHGLPPDPDVTMPFRYLHLAAEAPGFLRAGEALAPTAHLLRPITPDLAGDHLPGWVASLPDRPTIYATLGTISGGTAKGAAVFGATLAALRDEAINLILTVGRNVDPAQFGPQPGHVHIERFIPQTPLLPHCDLLVNHGGFHTATGALAAGLPQVLIPLETDQTVNAACCAALGVGRVLGPQERTAEALRAAVLDVLADPTYRANAAGVRDAIATLPGPEHAVALLERLARDQQPLLAAR